MKWAYSVLVPLQKLEEKLIQGFNKKIFHAFNKI